MALLDEEGRLLAVPVVVIFVGGRGVVPLDVHLQVATLGRGVGAAGALEWLLPGVYAQVFPQL